MRLPLLLGVVALFMQDVFVPENFDVPARLEEKDFLVRKLLESDAEKDYEAVMASVEHLRGAFGPDSTWPTDDLTLERNREELRWHEAEFDARRSFAYTVVAPDEAKVLGCVYVNPTRKKGYDAEVHLWVRASEHAKGFDRVLYAAVRRWLQEQWPFESIAFPGREIDWATWEALAESR